eukprot:585691-Prymnesium_polylepis.1
MHASLPDSHLLHPSHSGESVRPKARTSQLYTPMPTAETSPLGDADSQAEAEPEPIRSRTRTDLPPLLSPPVASPAGGPRAGSSWAIHPRALDGCATSGAPHSCRRTPTSAR